MFIVTECQECYEEFETEVEVPLSARYPRLEAFDADTVCPLCDLYQTFIIDPKEYL